MSDAMVRMLSTSQFTLDMAWDLLDLVDSFEMGHTMQQLVDSYCDGMSLCCFFLFVFYFIFYMLFSSLL